MCSSTGLSHLVDRLLQLQSGLHRLQRRAPLVPVRLGHVLQHDLPSPLVLVSHEELRVLALLVGALLEELGEAGEGDVLALEEEALKFQLKHHSISLMYYLFISLVFTMDM